MTTTTKVFVVRAKPHGFNRETQFLSGIISIGWPTQESLKDKDREELEKILKSEHPDITQLKITMVENFINIPIGSIVLTPSYKNRDIHIFATVEEYKYKPEWADDKIGNPHTIRVNHLKTVPRDHFSDITQKALLAAKKTITNFTQYSNEIQMIVTGQEIYSHENSKIITRQQHEDHVEARETLKELLKSSDDAIRLKAALALLDKE